MFKNTIIGLKSNSIYHTLNLSFILLLFLSFTSCESENVTPLIPNEDITTFQLETNDGSEAVHDESVGTIETRGSNTPPTICTNTWNNPPGCPHCQVHHANGTSFYFYCNGCIAYIEVCAKSSIKFEDAGGIFYQTLAFPAGNLYTYDFGAGYSGSFDITSQVLAPLGLPITTTYYFNCL